MSVFASEPDKSPHADPSLSVPKTDEAWVRRLLPRRTADSHKGTYGRAHLFCGSQRYPGAALLSCEAAFRVGCGMTYLTAPGDLRDMVLSRLPEVIFLPDAPAAEEPQGISARLCGCGCGNTVKTGELVAALLKRADAPLVLDADALNVLAADADGMSRLRHAAAPVILTPHPAEFSRLFGISVEKVQADRPASALYAAKESGAVVLLKGHDTLIASPAGELLCNPTGSSALAKAGSGDVLAGVICGLLAEGAAPFAAAAIGAWLHGKAGDLLSEELSEYGVLPSELPRAVARVLVAMSH